MNHDTILALFIALVSFLVGSIPTGLIISRAKGVDIRKIGSGNIGATNVLRALGKEAAIITLAGDIAKGIIPVALTPLLIEQLGIQYGRYEVLSFVANTGLLLQGLAGLSAVLGHNFSVFLNFRGGKGVATSIGVMLAFSPHAGLMVVTAWLMTASWTRFSSLSALVAFALSPLFVYAIDPVVEKIALAVILAILIFIRHRANIVRLIIGQEDKIGKRH
jgi:glycerol-3-phosphate acyltransferase PlsY